jgi:hypothetical protein
MQDKIKKAVARIAQRQLGLISFEQVIEAGGTEHFVRSRLDSGDWRKIYRGWFKVGLGPPTDEQRMLAAQLIAGPDAALSHFTAAKLLGLKVPHSPHIHVTVPRKRRGGVLDGDTKVHRVHGFGKHLTTLRLPYRVTNIGQTIDDLSSKLDARWLAAVVDSALVQRRAHLNPIISTFLGKPPERPETRRLGEILRKRVGMNAIPQSVLESMAFELGKRLPVPVVLQHPIKLPTGRIIHVDFAFPDHKLSLEFDGYADHSDAWSFKNDRRRDRGAFIAEGWTTLRFTWDEVNGCPDYTLKEISDALSQAEAMRRARSSA